MYYNFVSFKETSSTLLMHIVHWPKKYDDTRTEHGIVWPHHRNVTHINSHMESELTCYSVTSCKKFYTELKKLQKKESEGSVKPRNAEPSPPLQNSWEQLTLSSETLGKGFSVTPPPTYPSKGKKKCSLHCSVNRWETFWLAAGFGFSPQRAGIQCINTLNNLKYGLIVHKIGVPTRQRHRTDSNKWISFEVGRWRSECDDVNIKNTFIPACNDKWYEAPS